MVDEVRRAKPYLGPDELAKIFSVEEFEPLAKERMPIEGYSFYAGGAGTGAAVRGNLEAYTRWRFRMRALMDVSVDRHLDDRPRRGHRPPDHVRADRPPPVRPSRCRDRDGPGRRGPRHRPWSSVPGRASGSRRSGRLLTKPWFQLYWYTDRELTRSLVARAEASGFTAIAVTVDTPVPSWREEEDRLPPLPSPGIWSDNLPRDPDPPLEVDGSLTWASLEWLRSITSLPILLKGILTAEDARLAVEHGLDGIIVSNHGGRQLDWSLCDARRAARDRRGGRRRGWRS